MLKNVVWKKKINNNKKIIIKKREAALKNEAGGEEKHFFFFLLGLMYSYIGQSLLTSLFTFLLISVRLT